MGIKASLKKGSAPSAARGFSAMKSSSGIYQEVDGDAAQFFIVDCDGKVLRYDSDGPYFRMANAKYYASSRFSLIPFSLTIELSNDDDF